ncbi:MAG: hypothetical protein M0036_07240 [Desulfobacteraceae bacterium]|nr:hypothetical protein [Desulfobacteraceae bacterium]
MKNKKQSLKFKVEKFKERNDTRSNHASETYYGRIPQLKSFILLNLTLEIPFALHAQTDAK